MIKKEVDKMLDDIQLAMAKRAVNDIDKEKFNYQKMLDYVNSKTDILTNYPVTEFSNNIVTTNFINTFLLIHLSKQLKVRHI